MLKRVLFVTFFATVNGAYAQETTVEKSVIAVKPVVYTTTITEEQSKTMAENINRAIYQQANQHLVNCRDRSLPNPLSVKR